MEGNTNFPFSVSADPSVLDSHTQRTKLLAPAVPDSLPLGPAEEALSKIPGGKIALNRDALFTLFAISVSATLRRCRVAREGAFNYSPIARSSDSRGYYRYGFYLTN